MLVHIHGFNSSSQSRTFTLLRTHCHEAVALDYPSDGLFIDNFEHLRRQITQLHAASRVVLTGSSLGGFYASQLAAFLGRPCALFNPVVRPAEALQQFLGPNTHLHTGKQWTFTPAMLNSYAKFGDTRIRALARFVVLGRHDEVLDPAIAREYWQGHAVIHETDDEHSLGSLDATTLEALRQLVDGNGRGRSSALTSRRAT